MELTNSVSGRKDTGIYFLIALPVVLFNLIAVFGPGVILFDDAECYFSAIKGLFPFFLMKDGLVLYALTDWVAWKAMLFSPQAVRLVYLFIYMVPVSCLFYFILHKRLGIRKPAAYAAAVLPNILPAQHHIPAFINGSYVLPGLLVSFCCILVTFKFIEEPGRKGWKFLAAAILLYSTSALQMEHAVFFFPILVLIVLGHGKPGPKHLYFLGTAFLVFISRVAWTLLAPRPMAVITGSVLSKVPHRLEFFFSTMLPFPGSLRENNIPGFIFVAVVVAAGFFLNLRTRGGDTGIPVPRFFAHFSYKQYILYLYALLLTWVACHLFSFVFLYSFENLHVRYGYISAFALDALLVISLYPILAKIPGPGEIKIYIPIFLLIVTTGFFRYTELKPRFDNLNANQRMIQENFAGFQFPQNSQVVLVLDNAENFWGTWRQSSGHLRYMLKRKDINGLIGSKKSYPWNRFHRPFKVPGQSPGPRQMSGLRLKRPLFLFVQAGEGFKQYGYVLQWTGKEKDTGWTLYKTHLETGAVSRLAGGKGLRSYHAALEDFKSKGVEKDQILWSGPRR